MTLSSRKKTRKNGGKAIGSGGFGCVFRPALKCKNRQTRKKHMVSKVLLKKYANREYKTIKHIKDIVDEIPNYQRYFLVDNVEKCTPAPLSKKDLNHFDTRCKALEKHDGIMGKNVNANLNKLRMINLSDGGVTLETAYHNMDNMDNLLYINEELINLLEYGIIPMNNLDVYHADIKEANVLYNTESNHVGLIDWGLSFQYKNHIPSIIKDKPLQYNLPFSLILFNSTFDKLFKNEFKNHKVTYVSVLQFMKNFIKIWAEERGEGHTSVMEDIWGYFSRDEKVMNNIIAPYLTKVVLSFMKGKVFQKKKYFHEVFLPIVDVWGFLLCYSPILEQDIFDKREWVYSLYKKHLLDDPTQPINMDILIRDLHSL